MPADVRALAQEAVDLAEKAQPYQLWVMQSTHELAKAFSRHAGTHYATLARALLEALDERDEARRNYQFMVDRVADEKLDGYRELGSRAASAENDRDKILAALPHALRSCGCELKPAKFVPRQSMLSGGTMRMRWPEEHEAAIEWLKGRIK
jgi:Mg2+ and Co2+ transporter CorA